MTDYYSYKEISELLNKKKQSVGNRIRILGLDKVIIEGEAYIKKEDLEVLKAYYSPRLFKDCNKSKIKVLERYFVFYSYRDVARTLKMCPSRVRKVVDEWRQTGHIIVSSSMNSPERGEKIIKNGE